MRHGAHASRCFPQRLQGVDRSIGGTQIGILTVLRERPGCDVPRVRIMATVPSGPGTIGTTNQVKTQVVVTENDGGVRSIMRARER